MDELRKRIKKTSQKVCKAKNEEISKNIVLKKKIDEKTEESLLSEKDLNEIEKVRDFIEKYQK